MPAGIAAASLSPRNPRKKASEPQPPASACSDVRGGERNETHKKRAALLSSDARRLATGRFSRKHYFEESSKFWRSGRNALRINDYLADHRPENTLLEFDQLAARSFHNASRSEPKISKRFFCCSVKRFTD